MACGCGCGGNCSKKALGDDFGYDNYRNQNRSGYYMADPSADDVRKIAEEEVKRTISIESGSKILSGDFSPVVDVAERTARRVCEQGAKEELSGCIPLGIGILAVAFILGRMSS